jgi:uncharacterized membrane protein HdeD (DUF308 family)
MTDAAIKPATPGARTPTWWRTGLVIYGALLVPFGLGAVLAPLIATFVASVLFGGILVVSGLLGLFMAAADWRAKGAVWRMLWAAVTTLAGLCIYFHPWGGALALTLVLGASLIAQGLIGVCHALSHRDVDHPHWGWMAVGGVATTILGALLVWMLPHSVMMIPGLFLAVALMSFGLSLISAGFSRGAAKP